MADFFLFGFTALFVLALLATQKLGSALAGRVAWPQAERETEKDRTGHILTSTFSLLALLIGFSFGIALDRFETRRADVVNEANAIGTAHYRAGFLLPQGGELQQALADYATSRTIFGQAGPGDRKRLEIEAAGLRSQIARAGHEIDPVANSPVGSLVVAGVTNVLDIGVEREANLRSKLPWTVFVVLIGLSFVGAGMLGFAYPLGGAMRQGPSLSLFIMLALTINVIVDLDRPAGGGIVIDQTPMRDLAAQLRDEQPEVGRAKASARQTGADKTSKPVPDPASVRQ